MFCCQVIAVEVRDYEAQAERVRTEGEARGTTEADTDHIRLTKQWQQIHSRFVQYQKPTDVKSEQTTAPSDGDTVTQTVMSTADVSTIMFSDYSHYEENLRKLLGIIGEVGQGLQAQVLCGREYEEFSQQEDKLKVGVIYLSFIITKM